MNYSKAIYKSKITDINDISEVVSNWKANNENIVFTNGCFDIIHLGHIDYLSKAAMLGSKLIIGVNTDSSVRKIKGKNRPIQDEESRTNILAAFEFVDMVVLFDEETPLDLISKIVPDILVKGSDYNKKDIVGYNLVVKNGGEVKTIDFLDGYSTTKIEKKIIESNS